MNYTHVSLAMLSLLALSACGGDDTPATTENDTDSSSSSAGDTNDTLTTTVSADDTSSSGGVVDDSSESDSGNPPVDSSSSEDSGPEPVAAEFEVTITNISGDSVLPSSIGQLLWIEQELGSQPVFTQDFADRDEGLVPLASDGDPTELNDSLMAVPEVVQRGLTKGDLAPGDETSFTFTAEPGDRLSLLAGFGAGNDHFIGTGSLGVALFANNMLPLDERDISEVLRIWEVGTEYNQAPGQGFDQLSTQSAAGVGMVESGAVTAFRSSTRALPQAGALLDVDVATDAKNPETLIITVTNIEGTVDSDLSATVWALHEDTVTMFDAGGDATAIDGFEELVEDGEGDVLQAALALVAGVGDAQLVEGATGAGESFVITVTPDQDNRMISFVSSIAASNDAFVGPNGGIALLDEDGSARTNAQIEADFVRNLVVWDAGTEENEVPGAGNNTQSEQLLPGTGNSDDDATIRPYSELVNDLAGPSAGGLLEVTVEETNPGEFEITIENTSGSTAYPAAFSPVLWAVHDDSATLFEADAPASASLEMLAEDGDPTALLSDLMGAAGVVDADVDNMPLGAGASFSFTITPDASAARLSIAAMVIPSNDTFVSLGANGMSLLDDKGDPLTAELLEDAIASALGAWDAGTEANQAGACGADQAPRQSGDNTGANEGTGLVRSSEDDGVWAWPAADQVIRVTVAPTGN